jgi:hypothetical protein
MNERARNRRLLAAEVTLVAVIVALLLATWLPALVAR